MAAKMGQHKATRREDAAVQVGDATQGHCLLDKETGTWDDCSHDREKETRGHECSRKHST